MYSGERELDNINVNEDVDVDVDVGEKAIRVRRGGVFGLECTLVIRIGERLEFRVESVEGRIERISDSAEDGRMVEKMPVGVRSFAQQKNNSL